MKAFRGTPSIYTSTQPADRQAELEVKKVFLNFGGVMALHGHRAEWCWEDKPHELYHGLLPSPKRTDPIQR